MDGSRRGVIPGLRRGAIVAGTYRIEDVLGAGGMGVVFAAVEIATGARVAIKMLLDVTDGTVARARFLREARASAVIRNEHAIRVLDAGEQDGMPYMVMERLEGGDFARLLRARGALPVEQVAIALREACLGVGAAHAHGIVHRDIKPSNLFVAKEDAERERIVVLDFGISKATSNVDLTTQDLTATTDVFGSPRYMSPEQIRSAKNVDARADIWALGIVAYEALTHRRPFDAETLAALAAVILEDEPTPPRALRPEVPAELEAVVLRCLRKKPEDRFPDVNALAAALEPFTQDAQLSLLRGVTLEAAPMSRAPERRGPIRVADTRPDPARTKTLAGAPEPAPESTSFGDKSTHLQASSPFRGPMRHRAFALGAALATVITVGSFFAMRSLSREAPRGAAETGATDASAMVRPPLPPSAPCTLIGRRAYPTAHTPSNVHIAVHARGAALVERSTGDGLARVLTESFPLSERATFFDYKMIPESSSSDVRAVPATFRDEPVIVAAHVVKSDEPRLAGAVATLTSLEPPGGPFMGRGFRRIPQSTYSLAAITLPNTVHALALGLSVDPKTAGREEVRIASLLGMPFEVQVFVAAGERIANDLLRDVSASSGATRAIAAFRSDSRVRAFVVEPQRTTDPFEVTGANTAATTVARGNDLYVVWLDGKRAFYRKIAANETEPSPAKPLGPVGVEALQLTSDGDRIFMVWREAKSRHVLHYGSTRGELDEIMLSPHALDGDLQLSAIAYREGRLWIAHQGLSPGVVVLDCHE